MINAVIVWLIFVVAVAVLCFAKPNAGRIFLGLFFLAMAIGVNIVLALTNPQSYVDMGKNAFIPFYREFFLNIVVPNPALFILLAAVYQIAIGLLILDKKNKVKIGLVGGIIFTMMIIPLGLEELPNPILALTQAYLFTKDFDKTFLEILHSKLRGKYGK